MVDWRPTVEQVTTYLHRWTEGGIDESETAVIRQFSESAAADVVAEVGSTIPAEYWGAASTAAALRAAFLFLLARHPEEDDLLRQAYRDEYESALERLRKVVAQTVQDPTRRKYGSPRLGNDYINRYTGIAGQG